MLPKQNRLNIRTYYTEIRGTGKKISDNYFSLYFRVSQNKNVPKVNAIISKKIAKSAVLRNRMRRLLHTAVQSLMPSLKNGVEGLFFIHKDYTHENSEEITKIVHKIFKSGGMLQDESPNKNI